MKRFSLFTLFAFSVLFLSGCITFDSFQLLQSDIKPKGKKIAVISGLNHELNGYVAESMTASLKKETAFKVISQRRIAKRIKDYPYNIQGPYKKAYFNIEQDYSNTDVKALKKIAKRLKVNYLYVMWVPTATSHGGFTNTFDIITQLYEFPAARPVGQGRFMAGSAGTHSNCFLFGGAATAEDDKQGIRDMMDHVAKEIGSDMKMGLMGTSKKKK